MKIIGIDVGGTKILGIIFDTRSKKVMERIDSESGSIRQIQGTIEMLIDRSTNNSAIGISFAGVVDKGKVVGAPNITKLIGKNLASAISKKFKRKVMIENDANCFAYAESKIGKGKNKKNFLFLAFGSGIGGGFINNGKLYRGRHGGASEFGRTIVLVNGKPYKWEEIAAKQFFFDKGLDAFEVEKRARAGDSKAKRVYEEFGRNVGIGIVNVMRAYDPEIIYIGGGLSFAYDLYKKEMEKVIKTHIPKRLYTKIKIETSKLNREGGAIGAAILASEMN